jgi:hypothetical protein
MWVWYDIDKIKAREIEILDDSLTHRYQLILEKTNDSSNLVPPQSKCSTFAFCHVIIIIIKNAWLKI